jgi:hypothetical protein
MDHEKVIEKNISLVSSLLDSVVKSERKDQIKKMLESDFGTLYFSAPASSREEYHYCWPGGLVSHSLNVYKNLRKLNTAFDLGFSEESMFIVTMFHDIGKASDTNLDEPHYVKTSEDWRLRKGWLYEYSTKGVYMPNHLRSVFILGQFQIQLSAEEYMAIFLNDNQYLDSNKEYRLKECSLSLYTHMADRIALEQERKDKK